MEQLKRIRKDRGLSQAKLAARAGLDPSTVNQIETGGRKPSTATLEKIAEALDVELADLFRGYEIPKVQPPLPDFNGEWRLETSYWIATLDNFADWGEHLVSLGDADLKTLFFLEGVTRDLWGAYARTVRRQVREGCSPSQLESLQSAEARMKATRRTAGEAYRARRETETDQQKVAEVDELAARRQAREEGHAEQGYADTGS